MYRHGLGGISNVFQIQADALAPHSQVIRPSFAAPSRSPLAGPVSIESHATDVASALDTLGAATRSRSSPMQGAVGTGRVSCLQVCPGQRVARRVSTGVRAIRWPLVDSVKPE